MIWDGGDHLPGWQTRYLTAKTQIYVFFLFAAPLVNCKNVYLHMIFAALKPTRCNSFPFCQKSMSILLPLACKKIVWFLLYFHSNVVWFWAFVGILNGKECMLFISITNLLLLLWHINCRQKIFSCTLFMPLDGKKMCIFSQVSIQMLSEFLSFEQTKWQRMNPNFIFSQTLLLFW